MWQYRFSRTVFQPGKLLENAQTLSMPTPAYLAGDRVHVLLDARVGTLLALT